MRQSEITEWTGKLINTLGRPRNPIDQAPLKRLHAEKDYNGLLRAVRAQLLLDIPLRAAYVNSGGPSDAPAWIGLPEHMPVYGTRHFREYKLTIYLRKEFLARAPFGTVVIAMAHEMAHVILESTYHPLRTKEEAVDLTAMLFGFRELFLSNSAYESRREIHPEKVEGLNILERVRRLLDGDGPQVEITSHNLGYLTHDERAYANWIMERWP